MALFLVSPHPVKISDKKRELCFAAALTGLVLYFLLENTALSTTYASNVGIIVACAPFFVAVMVGIFFKEKQGVNFFIGFVIAITGVILISLS
ncbi:EamA family transporter [Roseburia sp. BX1005]|uniref:EamA family transporter n=1 Tax=Roseburia zhanii TaxID=2763064 RepID=A0A923LM19_9FIRM|nr:EamA family transporter [Roseburia zhanii]